MAGQRLRDRAQAGRLLAQRLIAWQDERPLVVGLPRGGVPVAAEVARALSAPLDVVVVRKVGVPWQPELAMGAVGEDNVRVLNDSVVAESRLDESTVEHAFARAAYDVTSRSLRLRGQRTAHPVAGRSVIIVDDGIATGATARAACLVMRARGAARVILACPVAAEESVQALSEVADAVVCLLTPARLGSISMWYDDFRQVSDEEVAGLLAGGHRVARRADTQVTVGTVTLPAVLTRVEPPLGAVVFAHGSGSSRLSPRNTHVAERLNDGGLSTLLLDLLTEAEAADRANVFDTGLLASRLLSATTWLRTQPGLADAPIGYFGASTGAAAALLAAAARPPGLAAVVSRGGRPDLAVSRLPEVRTPTLLLVGSRDREVLELNRRAMSRMHCPVKLVVVPGASHLFEEPGTLDQVAQLACDWFEDHFAALSASPTG